MPWFESPRGRQLRLGLGALHTVLKWPDHSCGASALSLIRHTFGRFRGYCLHTPCLFPLESGSPRARLDLHDCRFRGCWAPVCAYLGVMNLSTLLSELTLGIGVMYGATNAFYACSMSCPTCGVTHPRGRWISREPSDGSTFDVYVSFRTTTSKRRGRSTP